MADFSDKLVQILNYGSLNLGLGIGYALEIFDVMDEKGSALTLGELAGATGLNSRYLMEWLGIMVTGGIIEMTQKPDNDDTFFLPLPMGIFCAEEPGTITWGFTPRKSPC